jgi:hypothetical protein
MEVYLLGILSDDCYVFYRDIVFEAKKNKILTERDF